MKVFLTGGTGFIGQPLAKALLAKGHTVIVPTRNTESAQSHALLKAGALCVEANVLDKESMRRAMCGSDLVIHCAGFYEYGVSTAAKREMWAVNVEGTKNVLSLAYELGVPRTIYMSTVLAYGDSGPRLRDENYVRSAPYRSYYEQTKSEAHWVALEYRIKGLPIMIVCPNGVIGPNDHSAWGYFLRLYLNHSMPPVACSPDTVYSLVDVDDVVNGIILAAQKGRLGETYFLTGESKSFREHLEIWNRWPGGSRTWYWLPSNIAAALMRPLEALQPAVGLPAVFSRETVQTSNTHLNYSSAKAERELGWTHKSAEEMWFRTIEAEMELMKQREKPNFVTRLKPVDMIKVNKLLLA